MINLVSQGQHFAKNYPMSLHQHVGSVWSQDIHMDSDINTDFIAVSISIEGHNIDAGHITCTLVTQNKTVVFKPFGEDPLQTHKFVSDIIYLDPNDTGTWELKISGSSDIDFGQITGFVRVFCPSKEQSRPLVGKTSYDDGRNACTCLAPDFVPRSVWGASYQLSSDIYRPPAAYTNVTHLIVHHSAGTNTSNNWKGVVASVFDLHVFTNGWQDVGYNWLIDPNGEIYEGRGGGD
ncbi:MAG: hypothetical protein WBO36_13310, partial [Saprospiraceae bacterium]